MGIHNVLLVLGGFFLFLAAVPFWWRAEPWRYHPHVGWMGVFLLFLAVFVWGTH